MHITDQLEQTWQDRALDSIINIVRAPDGDFESIGELADAMAIAKAYRK